MSLPLGKGLLIYFFCCFLGLLSSLECSGTGVGPKEQCVAHTAFMSHRSLQRGRTMHACSTKRLAWQRRGGCTSPLASPLPISPTPLRSAAHLTAPAARRGGDSAPGCGKPLLNIACGPQEVSAWETGQIHFVIWPNNFLSCQFIEKRPGEKKKKGLSYFL